jgi:hypothetical protein
MPLLKQPTRIMGCITISMWNLKSYVVIVEEPLILGHFSSELWGTVLNVYVFFAQIA